MLTLNPSPLRRATFFSLVFPPQAPSAEPISIARKGVSI